jgi:natural product precursor
MRVVLEGVGGRVVVQRTEELAESGFEVLSQDSRMMSSTILISGWSLLLQEPKMKKDDKKIKKLNLNKETLRSLEDTALNAVLGGASLRLSNCAACTSTCP